MKSNFISLSYHDFKKVAIFTFIVYFITAICGWCNFFLAKIWDKIYFPIKSYLVIFDKSSLSNFQNIESRVYNLTGLNVKINSPIPYKLIDDLFFIALSTALVILFYIGYRIIQTNKISQVEIIKWSVIFSLLMAAAIPSHSSDLYGYIARGAQQSLYSQNPYLQTVSEIKNWNSNQLLANFMWPSQPTTYGPVFIYLTKAIVTLSNNNFLLSIINFKLFNLTFFFLLILFAQRMNNTKDIYLLAWNPLILIQGLWNCHNDLFSGVLIFLGLYLILKQNYFWSAFCLTFAAGIKYVPLLIIPIVFFYILKNKPERETFLNLVLGFCCGIILIIIFSIDYLILTNQLALSSANNILNKFIANVSLAHQSLVAAMFTLVKYYCDWQKINFIPELILNIIKYFFYFIFCLFYLFVLLKKRVNLMFDIILILFIFFCFIIPKFHSWYLLNFILFIPLLDDKIKESCLLKNILIALSIANTYALTFIYQAKILNFVFMTLLPVLLVLLKGKKK